MQMKLGDSGRGHLEIVGVDLSQGINRLLFHDRIFILNQ